jgi:hypothetical protein
MKPQSILVLALGICLTIFGLFVIVRSGLLGGIIPLVIGLSLCYLGWRGGRTPLVVFGHACIVVGCLLITWGVYLVPHSQPTLLYTFTRPRLLYLVVSVLISMHFVGVCGAKNNGEESEHYPEEKKDFIYLHAQCSSVPNG